MTDLYDLLLAQKLSGGGGGGGGGGAYKLLGSQEYNNVQSQSSTETYLGTVDIAREAWSKDKIIYVKVRDKTGKKNGYFYGMDEWFVIPDLSAISVTNRIGILYKTDSNGVIVPVYNATYGVFASAVNKPPNEISLTGLPFRVRYSSSTSGSINGDFKVEIYQLEWPDGVSPLNPT